MADIHMLNGSFDKDNGSGVVRVVFHVPNTNNNYPGGVISSIPGLSQGEIDGLANGTIIEVIRAVRSNHGRTIAETRAQIRDMWATVASRTQARINKEYRFYGTTLARA